MFAVALSLLAGLVPQDLELVGGRVHTGSGTAWEGPLVVTAGRIQSPGTAPAAGARRIDLHGAFVMPGLQDAHGHLGGLGAALEQVDLVGAKSFDEVIERVKAAASKARKGTWILGRGWDQNRWRVKQMPHHAELSAEVPDHPVWLVRVDGHAGLLNLTGLFKSGITRTTEAPSGGEILHDDDGEPTGVLVDRAMEFVNTTDLTPEESQARLLRAQQECFAHGLTCVHDAGVSRHGLDDLRLLHLAGKWHLRTYVMLSAGETELIQKGPWRSKDGLIDVRAVKGYADGALGSYGAALLQPYADRKGWKGLLLTQKPELQKLAQMCADAGMQLCTHAIGDAANRTVLDVYEATRFAGDRAAARFRIEHAQVVAPADVARFQSLGVLPSMQPTHLTSDMPWAPTRLGTDRVASAYAWRSFHAIGVRVPFGSDFPVESVDPRLGLFAACTTRAVQGGPPEGFRPEQKLDRAAALAGFTRDAAFAMFAENDLGEITPGRLADLTIVDRDLLTCTDDELLQARVKLTIVGGVVVYEAGS